MIADTLQRLASLHPKLIDLSLNRMEGLLARFNNPHLKLPPTFHVAGTNGKGSTCAFLRSILEAAGYKAHVYISPHLVKFNERFRVAGEIVSDELLASILEEVERVNNGEPITQFEITTIAGFLLFSRIPADFLILEVGLGGRFDATNVIQKSLCSLITPVSIDHQDYLGDTIDKIAFEKAGIIKRGGRVVIAPQTALAKEVLEAKLREQRATGYFAGQDYHAFQENGRLIYQDEQGLLDLPAPALLGDHQFMNAGLAIAALRHSNVKIRDKAFEQGLKKVEWQARMQRLKHKSHDEIWLDGGHNEAGGEVLSKALEGLNSKAPKPLQMIVGMINTKEPTDFLKSFSALQPIIHAIPFDYPAALPPQKVVAAANELGMKASLHANLTEALRAVPQNARVCICGSLYLAGEVLREWEKTHA